MCTSRIEYVDSTIKCLNSFWEFNPDYSACIWLDTPFWERRIELFAKLDRPKQTFFRTIPEATREWQWNKLLIIVDYMESEDFFSDADIIWNGKLPEFNSPAFFLKEFDLMKRAASRRLLSNLDIVENQGTFMYNVSFVKLLELSKHFELSETSKSHYEIIRGIEPDEILGEEDIPSLHRMSEQIAISLAAQGLIRELSVLKNSDHVMDGGIAESYYLGSSSGWQ